MGIVYLARDVQLDRDVAIKVLPSQLASAESRQRFVREARTAAGLSHPNIVPIHRVGEARGFVFFVMSYIEGETLGERLRTRGPLPAADAARVMREVAWALAYAHSRGIVHRDVKPDNILLEAGTGRALVTDFGIAHGGGDPDQITDPGKIQGTTHFMSPEQAAGARVDSRSDIYSLGVVGHLAVSGRLPSESPDLLLLPGRNRSEEQVSILRVAPGLPPALGAAIDRCLSRDPLDRFQDGEALADALAPKASVQPALPPTLRAWLGARNPLLFPYLAWSAGFTVLTVGNAVAWLTGNPGSSVWDAALLGTIAASPLVPIVGFHLNQARRQFLTGHTLADLRTALQVESRERAETEAIAIPEKESRVHRLLRFATIASASWLAVMIGLMIQGVMHENRTPLFWIFTPVLSTMGFGALSNALDVQFIPAKIRQWWQTGIRDRLWNSRVGEWISRKLGAPERSRAIGEGVFRPTEAALGVAASELFASLPTAYRDQLAELPSTVAALEAHAAEARAQLDVFGGPVPSGSDDTDILERRRKTAATHLAQSVAALEGIRLDLLRLHAGSGDLAPLTTLIHEARAIEEDLSRLAEAQLEIEEAMEHT